MNNVGQQLVSHPVSLFLFFLHIFLFCRQWRVWQSTQRIFSSTGLLRLDLIFFSKKKRCGRCGRRIVRGGMPTPANEWAASFPLFCLSQNGRCRALRMKTLKTRRAEWPDSSSPRRRRFMCRRRLCCRLHMICRLDGGNVGQGLEQTSTAATAATAAPKKRD